MKPLCPRPWRSVAAVAVVGCLAMSATQLSLGAASAQSTGASAPRAKDAFAAKLHAMFDDVEADYRPSVRWWLAEGLNTDDTLRKNVQEIQDSGFGAAEIAVGPSSTSANVFGVGPSS